MKEDKRSREEVRDIYESHGIDMSTAVDRDQILETPAKDSPAMTGESKEETDYVNFEDNDSNSKDSDETKETP